MGGNLRTTEFLKECLADALIKLLKEKPIEKITIPEISEYAFYTIMMPQLGINVLECYKTWILGLT